MHAGAGLKFHAGLQGKLESRPVVLVLISWWGNSLLLGARGGGRGVRRGWALSCVTPGDWDWEGGWDKSCVTPGGGGGGWGGGWRPKVAQKAGSWGLRMAG